MIKMTRIGLISDTHGYFDEKVFEYFKDCDEVWHAGDFGEAVVERFKSFAQGNPPKESFGPSGKMSATKEKKWVGYLLKKVR